MKAHVIFSKFFSPEKEAAARNLLEKLNIQIENENEDESIQKLKIITKTFSEIPYGENPDCLTITPHCLQYIISMNSNANSSIHNPFDLLKYGNFFYNLFLLDKKVAFGNISEESKERLSKKIKYMGGEIVPLNDKKAFFILTEEKCDNPNHIPLILPSWIDSLFESSFEIDINRFRIDDGEAKSANGSPNNSVKRPILLANPKLANPKQNLIFKNKNASSQPVNSQKSRSKKMGKGIPTLDSGQTTLNFVTTVKNPSTPNSRTQSNSAVKISSTQTVRSQGLVLSKSSSQISRKQLSSSSSRSKLTRKQIAQKVDDNVMKIDNFMKVSPARKSLHPPSSQLKLVEGKNNSDEDNENDDDDDDDDAAIDAEALRCQITMEKMVQRHIEMNHRRTHGKLIPSPEKEEEEIEPLFISKNVNKKKDNLKSPSLKKVAIVPSILSEMTENPILSSDNESETVTVGNSSDKKPDKKWDNLENDLNSFSFEDASSKNKNVQSEMDLNKHRKIFFDRKHETEFFSNLTSFSQSCGDFGESQGSVKSSVYYDRDPAENDEKPGRDPVIDCWDLFQTDVNN